MLEHGTWAVMLEALGLAGVSPEKLGQVCLGRMGSSASRGELYCCTATLSISHPRIQGRIYTLCDFGYQSMTTKQRLLASESGQFCLGRSEYEGKEQDIFA